MNMRNENSLFDARNDEQREQQQRVQNYGAGENFLDQQLKYEAIHLALESVDAIVALQSEGEPEPREISLESKERITQAVSKVLGEEVAAESVNEKTNELTDAVTAEIIAIEGVHEKPTAWDIFDGIACEAVGIDGIEKPTQDQMEDYRNMVSQVTHALGCLTGEEKGAELALEAVNNEDSEQLLRTCTFIQDHLNHTGIDDDDVALEYVLDAAVVGDSDEDGNIAIEKVQIKFVGGKKVKVKKRKKKIRGAALARMKKAGRKSGKLKKSAATRKLMKKSMLKRKKAGF